MIYNHRDKITKYLTDQVFHKIYGSGPKTYTHYITNLHIMCNKDIEPTNIHNSWSIMKKIIINHITNS